MNLDFNETKFTKIEDIVIPASYYTRLKTNNPIIDDFFSGGIMPGASFTLTGQYGCGKSSFVIQYLEMLHNAGYNYRTGICSSEEVIQQVAYTCKRLNAKNIEIANISNVDKISKSLDDYDIIVVDSFQGLTHPKYEGKVRAIEKYAIETLYTAAKDKQTALGFICHITKMGDMKGGTIVPHTVDMNIAISKGESETDRKISITKNRFGACNEISCTISENGFNFNNCSLSTYVENDNKKESIKQQILSLPQPITLSAVTQLLNGNSSKAYFLLREMTMTNILTKNGRGENAIFTKTT